MLIKYKLNLFSSWKPYQMDVFLADRPLYIGKRKTSLMEPTIVLMKSKTPEWDPFVFTVFV